MITLLVLGVVHAAAGHYCEIPECPGFSLVKSVAVTEVTREFIGIVWEPRKDYAIESYEVQWFADSGCLQCNGKHSLTNNTLKLKVRACTYYTIEVYAFDANNTSAAPYVVRQITAPNPLTNGTTVRVGENWAVVRWFEVCKCPNSIHTAVCFGPNSAVQLQPSYPDNVVLFNFSTLRENSEYVCNAYTLNSAGSSTPSLPIFFKTGEGNPMEGRINITDEFVLIPIIVFVSLTSVVTIYILNKKGIIQIAWRRSYTVNESRI